MERISVWAFVILFFHSTTSSVLNSNGGIKNALPTTDAKPAEYTTSFSSPSNSENHVYKYNNGYVTEDAGQMAVSPQSNGGSGFPLFGVVGNADMNLSGYFSQAFWWFVGLSVSVSFICWILSLFSGLTDFGGFVKKLKEGGATGKSIDFDRLTNLVYDAIDTYGTWAEKDIREGRVSAKGK